MEPGHEDREYAVTITLTQGPDEPQWSPVMKTGNTRTARRSASAPTSLNGARS